MQIAGFGHGLPLGLCDSLGLCVTDVTLDPPVPAPGVAGLIEPFMDPFAASLLQRLAGGTLNDFDLLLFFREAPGAHFAYHYACRFQELGLLPEGAPALQLSNLLIARGPAEAAYNASELALLPGGAVPGAQTGRGAALAEITEWQSAGRLHGAEAFERRRALARGMRPAGGRTDVAEAALDGPRLALAGAPLGNACLHRWLDVQGALVLDRQGLDTGAAAAGDTTEAALAAWAHNPFAARQAAGGQVAALLDAMLAARVEVMIWQVDAQDDLWGWDKPALFAGARAAGLRVADLGPLPRWPRPADLAALPPIAEAAT